MSRLNRMVEFMNGNIVDYIQALGEAGVAALADANSFVRGDAIDPRDVDALQFTGEEFYAQVMGTNPYLVKVWLALDDGAEVADRLSVHCTCPVPTMCCKHVVAVALRMVREPEWARRAPGQTFQPVDLVAEQLEKYGTDPSTAEVTMMRAVERTLGRMGRREVLGIVDKLRAAHPEITPTLTAAVEPYMIEPMHGELAVQEAVEEARYYSEKVWSADHVTEAARLWTIAVNTIASCYDRGNALTMMSALELAIMDINDLACHVAVPAGELVAVIDQACVLHLRIAEFAEPEEGILLEWVVESYLAPGFIPCDVEAYAPLLGDDVSRLADEAHAKVPLHPERVLELACDVAAVHDDLPRLKELMEQTETQDKLYRYYDSKGMTDEATELVDAALKVDNPVELSPPVRYEAARKYLEELGEYRFYQHRFVSTPSYKTFADFMAVDIVDYDNAVDTYYQSVAHTGVRDMNYVLLAAIEFGNFQGGFLAFIVGSDEEWEGEALDPDIVAEFAQRVVLPVDADFALTLIFVKIRVHMHLAMGTWSEETAIYNALDPELDHIAELYQLISDSPDAIRSWRREVERVEQEFRGYPEVAEGIAERGFMRWGL